MTRPEVEPLKAVGEGRGRPPRRVGVIGAGLSGLVAGYHLAPQAQVVIYEAAPTPGGLTRAVPAGRGRVEEFYHLLLPSDQDLIDLVTELGLADDLHWQTPSSAIFLDQKLYSFTSPLDILRFPCLSLGRRLALGLMVYRARYRKKWQPLDQLTAQEWVMAQAGSQVYQKVWAPLLHSKFDWDANRVSAAWLWNKFKLRGTSKNRTMSSELVGYLKGSFAQIINELADRIGAFGGEIRCHCPVTEIQSRPNGRVALRAGEGIEEYDAVIATLPPEELIRICPQLPTEYRQRMEQIKYKGNLCLRLELSRGLSPYYWILVAEASLPFVAVIEHTNFFPLPGSDRKLVYLSRYLDPSDALFSAPEAQIRDQFIEGLRQIFPDLSDSEILSTSLARARYAQPVATVGYLDLVPGVVTPLPNLYLASMAQIYPQDRGLSYAVRWARQAAERVNLI